jgi:large subunit ribosomal protein L3
MQGLIGRKIGMTSVHDDQGRQVPVTVLECGPCLVVRRQTLDRQGREALQLGFGDQVERRMTKPDLGVFKKHGWTPKRVLREFSAEPGETAKEGDVLTVALFEGVTHVDVTGTTKGRGFAGVVRRHRMAGGPHGHGGHSKRRIGSIGCRELPGRIHKGKRMPGHYGNVRVTQQNLRVVQVRKDDNALLVLGAVPGANGSVVIVRKAVKKGGAA